MPLLPDPRTPEAAPPLLHLGESTSELGVSVQGLQLPAATDSGGCARPAFKRPECLGLDPEGLVCSAAEDGVRRKLLAAGLPARGTHLGEAGGGCVTQTHEAWGHRPDRERRGEELINQMLLIFF